MRKTITLLLITALLNSCGVSITSVVDNSVTSKMYENSLIIIPYIRSTKNFSEKLKEKIQIEYVANNNKVEFILFEKKEKGLSLNSNNDIDNKINNTIINRKKDLLIIFKPTNLSYMDGGLRSATYEIVGIDTETKKEIWKAEFNSQSGMGPALLAEKSAKTIYDKLKTDNIYK